jgi:hypothetical protein
MDLCISKRHPLFSAASLPLWRGASESNKNHYAPSPSIIDFVCLQLLTGRNGCCNEYYYCAGSFVSLAAGDTSMAVSCLTGSFAWLCTVTLPMRFWIASVRPGSGLRPAFLASKHLSNSQIAAFSLFFSKRTSSVLKAAGTRLSASVCPSCMSRSTSFSSRIAVTVFRAMPKSLLMLVLSWPCKRLRVTAVFMAGALRDERGL